MREIIREYSRAVLVVIAALIVLGLVTGGKYIIRTFKQAKEANEFIDLDEFKYSTYINNNIQLGIYELPILSKETEDKIILRENLTSDSDTENSTIYYKAEDFIKAYVTDSTSNSTINEICVTSIEYTSLDGNEKSRLKSTYFLNGEKTKKEDVLKYINEENKKAGKIIYNMSDFEYFTFKNEGNYTISIRVGADGMYSIRIFSISLMKLV